MSTVPIFAPDGTLGDIPAEQLAAAVKAGAKPGVHIKSPDGQDGVIPADRTQEAVRAGAKLVPIEEQPIQHPGFLSTLYNSAGSMLHSMVPDSTEKIARIPSMAVGLTANPADAATMLMQQARESGAGQNDPSAFYRAVAPGAQALGLNVPGMEESAKTGDVGGVLAHGTAAAAPYVAGEVLSKVPIPEKVITAPVRFASRAAEAALNQKMVPVKAALNLMNPADEAAALQFKIPGRDFGLTKPSIPSAELTQAQSLMHGPQVVTDPAAGLGQIPVAKPPGAAGSMAESVTRPATPEEAANTARFLEAVRKPVVPQAAPTIEQQALQGMRDRAWQESVFGKAGETPQDVGAKVRAANPEPTRAEVQAAAEKALGVKKLQPDVPLKNQTDVLSAKKGPAIPEGHTPVESSALRSYKYDANAKEFTAATRTGNVQYVYGDVSAEDAAAFDKAESKGKAWSDIRQNPLVAKIVDGKRIPVKPGRTIVVDPETGKPEFSDLTQQLKKSVDIARAAKKITE